MKTTFLLYIFIASNGVAIVTGDDGQPAVSQFNTMTECVNARDELMSRRRYGSPVYYECIEVIE